MQRGRESETDYTGATANYYLLSRMDCIAGGGPLMAMTPSLLLNRFSSSSRKYPSFHFSDWWCARKIFHPRYDEQPQTSSCIVWAPVAISCTVGRENCTLYLLTTWTIYLDDAAERTNGTYTSVKRAAFPAKPLKDLVFGFCSLSDGDQCTARIRKEDVLQHT